MRSLEGEFKCLYLVIVGLTKSAKNKINRQLIAQLLNELVSFLIEIISTILFHGGTVLDRQCKRSPIIFKCRFHL
jgi:hypothetical protein